MRAAGAAGTITVAITTAVTAVIAAAFTTVVVTPEAIARAALATVAIVAGEPIAVSVMLNKTGRPSKPDGCGRCLHRPASSRQAIDVALIGIKVRVVWVIFDRAPNRYITPHGGGRARTAHATRHRFLTAL
jgi:hypothetical protein